MDLLPKPQEMTSAAGCCLVQDITHGQVCGLPDLAMTWLQRDLPDVNLQTAAGPGFRAVLGGSSAAGDGEFASQMPPRQEAYALRVTQGRIDVAANDRVGLWYGLQSAVQLLSRSSDTIPAGEVYDWPAIQRRGIHLDLKGYQPRFERLLETCHLLSRYRINTILLEVEDKLAYSQVPQVGVPGAYTPAQFRELSTFCEAIGIEVIPKLQCLGHVDYLLKHDRYAHLRENDHPFQYCPRNEEGMALWQAMAEELMECFPGHRYFHIGADETGNLGECPRCSPHSKASSYIHRVQQCIDVVLAAGRQPILWEDILRNLHGNLSEGELDSTWALGKEAVLMYWAYGYGGTGNTFPLLPRYQARGLNVWGASGFSGCGPSWIQNVPPLAERALNISAWTKTAIENELGGIVATGWTRIASADPPAEPPEACWFTMLYAAESMWWGQERSLSEFCGAASRSLFGTDLSPEYGPTLGDGAAGASPKHDVTVRAQPERFALLQAATAIETHDGLRQELLDTLRMYHGRLGVRMPDYRVDLVRRRLAGFEESLARHRHDLRAALEALYEDSTVVDAVDSRLGADDSLVARTRTLLAQTHSDNLTGTP